jgi:hypothetical protein
MGRKSYEKGDQHPPPTLENVGQQFRVFGPGP